MKKIFKSLVIFITILFLFSPICYATNITETDLRRQSLGVTEENVHENTDEPKSKKVNIKKQIKKEDGSLFEKIIAECIGGIAQTVFDFTSGEDAGIGFKDYDSLIFNDNEEDDSLSPFSQDLWDKTMDWYKIFASISR